MRFKYGSSPPLFLSRSRSLPLSPSPTSCSVSHFVSTFHLPRSLSVYHFLPLSTAASPILPFPPPSVSLFPCLPPNYLSLFPLLPLPYSSLFPILPSPPLSPSLSLSLTGCCMFISALIDRERERRMACLRGPFVLRPDEPALWRCCDRH